MLIFLISPNLGLLKATHKDVLRAIDNVLTQVSDSFRKLNFEPTVYELKPSAAILV